MSVLLRVLLLAGFTSSDVPVCVEFLEELVGFSVGQAFDSIVVHVAQTRHSEHGLCLLSNFKVLVDATFEDLDLRIRAVNLQVHVLDLILVPFMVSFEDLLQ